MFKVFFIAASLVLAGCATSIDSRAPAQATPSAASGPYLANMGIGPSAVTTDAANNVTPQNTSVVNGGAPTRIGGGENFAFMFLDKNKKVLKETISGIRIMGYSKSGKGHVLIRDVAANPPQAASVFSPLKTFGSIEGTAKAQNYQGKVMLANGDSVFISPATALSLNDIVFTFEDFDNDDASVVIQLQYQNPPAVGSEVGVRRVIVNPPVKAVGGGVANGGGGGDAGGAVNPPPPPEAANPKCRADGLTCQSSADCCGFCINNVCVNQSSPPSCQQDGSVCQSSASCCGFCINNVCRNQANPPSCLPDGSICQPGDSCCGFCTNGVCVN